MTSLHFCPLGHAGTQDGHRAKIAMCLSASASLPGQGHAGTRNELSEVTTLRARFKYLNGVLVIMLIAGRGTSAVTR